MKRILLLLLGLSALFSVYGGSRPKLVVQIVVGSMRAEDIDRYADQFCIDGIRLLSDHGIRYTNSRYDCQQTVTPVSLATLATGAMPSTHGVIGARWMDYASNRFVYLMGEGSYPEPQQLVAPTLSETLIHQLPGSTAVTVAADAISAVVTAGRDGHAWWLSDRCNWVSSPYYTEREPEWIGHINKERYNTSYIQPEWKTLLERSCYRNTRFSNIVMRGTNRRDEVRSNRAPLAMNSDYERLLYTPAGNTAILGFAKQAIVHYRLGSDEVTDMLNICLDPARYITEAFGPESVEVEDMYYRLDVDLADFFTFLFAQIEAENVVVVLTSDHGTSPSCDYGPHPVDRFNNRQFEVIVNSFLNVRYGTGDWVLAYEGKSLWLNHTLIYERGLNLSGVQNEVAIFAMQFSGVSHAVPATTMRTSYFGSGYARRMQNGFYPRRSGDVLLNFVPGCIEERDRTISASGSLYGYDTQVPLIFYGMKMETQRIDTPIDMTTVAPTLSHLMGITEPAASEGVALPEVLRSVQ